MIRIDLGKDELHKDSTAKAQRKLLHLIRNTTRSPLTRMTTNIGGIFVLLSGLLLACGPHLFFHEYRKIRIKQHNELKAELQDKNVAADAEIVRLTPFRKELESYESQKKVLTERLEAVRKILSDRSTPVFILDAVGQSVPQRAWITQLDLDIEGKGGIQIQGQALANQDVSDFVDRLSESVYLSDVVLQDVAVGRFDANVDVKTFQITAASKARMLAGAPEPVGGTK